jgi:hypothetical protein
MPKLREGNRTRDLLVKDWCASHYTMEASYQLTLKFHDKEKNFQLAKKGFSLARKKSKNEVFVEPEVPVCPPKLAEVNFQIIKILICKKFFSIRMKETLKLFQRQMFKIEENILLDKKYL